jgi:hypothetical protein
MFNLFFYLSQTLIHNGGIIPKQLYKTDSIEDNEIGNNVESDGDDVTKMISSSTQIKLNENNLYQNVKLRPGQFYEVIIKNDDKVAKLFFYLFIHSFEYDKHKKNIVVFTFDVGL